MLNACKFMDSAVQGSVQDQPAASKHVVGKSGGGKAVSNSSEGGDKGADAAGSDGHRWRWWGTK
jgi:hypothetical protein